MGSFNDYIVNCKILKNNAINIKNILDKNTKFCAVVKANAYGLGVETICKSLYGIADFFAVANLKEALNIRLFDKCTKIVVLGVVSSKDLKLCSENNISLSVPSAEYLKENLQELDFKLNIHLQVNTGLNRFGIKKISDFRKVLKMISSNSNLNLEGIYSHFATKSQDIVFIKKQFVRFNQFKKYVGDDVICHIANSYATIMDKRLHLDMVRNGFLLYGGQTNTIGNCPVLTIKSRIVNIFDVKKYDTIGYDRTYRAMKNMKLAVVPMGYADGLDRHLSNKFSVLIGGKFCPIVGLICMDVFMVDISHIKSKVGDEVVLLGRQYKNEITLHDYAKALNTSPYEVLLKFNYKRMNYIVKYK